MANSILGIRFSGGMLSLCPVIRGKPGHSLAFPAEAEGLSQLPGQLRQLCRTYRLPRRCALLLPEACCRVLSAPTSRPEDRERLLRREFGELFPDTELSLGCHLRQTDTEAPELLAAAAPRALTDLLRREFSRAGLELAALLPTEAALENILAREGIRDTVAVFDSGTLGLFFFSQGAFRMGRTLDPGEDTVLQLRQALNFYGLSAQMPRVLYTLDAQPEVPGISCCPLPLGPEAGAALDIRRCSLLPEIRAIRPARMLPLLAVLTALLLLGTKFGILEPLAEKAGAYQELSYTQELLTQAQQRLDGLDRLQAKYLRFGTQGMTQDELLLPGPGAMLELLTQALPGDTAAEALTYSGGVLTLSLRSDSLHALDLLVQALEAAPQVASAELHSAVQSGGQVRATLRLILTGEVLPDD